MFSSPLTSAAAHGETVGTWYLVQERDRNPRGPEERSHILNVWPSTHMQMVDRKTLRLGSVKSLTEYSKS